MSDSSQGDGWWLASDGKWYPPTQEPGYRPIPVPTPEQNRRAHARLVGGRLIGAGVLVAAAALVLFSIRDEDVASERSAREFVGGITGTTASPVEDVDPLPYALAGGAGGAVALAGVYMKATNSERRGQVSRSDNGCWLMSDRPQREPTESLDPYAGPTEDESLAAIGTSREDIERLAEGWGMPSGLEAGSEETDDGWLDDYTEGSTNAAVMERVKRGMRIWGPEASADEIAASEIARGDGV